ncbi:hypothetical protein M885DRAFT_537784 [Pelagophyceae sp. CCMP2097]|nr:hypothetical protein M885DRAFT_537784 [Pelagophyceae sp. CCMP2097]
MASRYVAQLAVCGAGLAVFVAAALRRAARKRRAVDGVDAVVDGVDVYVCSTTAAADHTVDALGFCGSAAVGLDCEWPPERSRARHRVAVVQVASARGCAVIRLAGMAALPPRLVALLRSASVAKVGVGIDGDAQRLRCDFGAVVSNTRDLRDLARARAAYNATKDGLEALARVFAADATLPHKGAAAVCCGAWDAPTLSDAQVAYAAGDAIASFKVLLGIIAASARRDDPRMHDDALQMPDDAAVLAWLGGPQAEPVGARGRKRTPAPRGGSDDVDDRAPPAGAQAERTSAKRARRLRYEQWHVDHSKRPLYDNVELRCNGALLGMINEHKARWYVDKGMATRDSPEAIELTYTPEVADGDGGWLEWNPVMRRKNECVGCGAEFPLTRFYVVPYAFRRCFPVERKSYSSHDVVALCLRCRDVIEPAYRDEERALIARAGGADRPAAPDDATRARRAATALLRPGAAIPPVRRRDLEALAALHYGDAAGADLAALVAADARAAQAKAPKPKPEDTAHDRVLRHVLRSVPDAEAAFHSFEVRWRALFVDHLRPTHLPEGWDVSHEDRPRSRPTAGESVCRAFLNGRCTWGENCKYLHDKSADRDAIVDQPSL